MNILHINDLHIMDPKNVDEALRTAFYQEYIETLIENINVDNNDIQCILVTGDIVEKSKVENYPHAELILRHIANELSIDSRHIFIVNGNHDVNKDSGDKTAFNEFSEKFNCSDLLISRAERFSLYKFETGEGVLCLDSIGTSYASGNPSALDKKIKDDIVITVRENNITNLMVLSHHPPESYSVQNQAPFDEGGDWASKHIWADGGNLHKRLSSKKTISGNAFWFAGDIHRPEYCIIDRNRVLIITGSLNSYEGLASSIPPQARVVSISNIRFSYLYQYIFEGHNRKGLEGHWESRKVAAQSFNSQPYDQFQTDTFSIQEAKSNTLKDGDLEIIEDVLPLMTRIDENLENDIYTSIIEKEIYEFGRFDTNPDITSLSWVSIHTLFESYNLFLETITAFKQTIDSLVACRFENKECLLVGISSWGSILASRLSSATDIRSCCVAIRSSIDSYDNVERINEELKQIVTNKKIVFVVSDVISSGGSIYAIRRELDCAECMNWYNLTVFCDPTQERNKYFQGYKETFYICGSVKMPIIRKDKLPGTDILNSDITFMDNDNT